MYKSTLVFLTIILFSLKVNAQEKTGHFKLENREITWQKVFETDYSFSELQKAIQSSLLLEESFVGDSIITGCVKKLFIDDGEGKYTLGAPTFYSRFVNFYVLIGYKSGKYRVTIRRIKYSDCRLEQLAVKNKKDKFTYDFYVSARFIEQYFIRKFDFNQYAINENW